MRNLRKVLGKLNPKNDAVFMGYALQFRQSIWMSGGELISGSSHIRIVLIGIKYQNCRRTLDVYLLFVSYLDGANSIKTDLHICNLWTFLFVSYKFVIQI